MVELGLAVGSSRRDASSAARHSRRRQAGCCRSPRPRSGKRDGARGVIVMRVLAQTLIAKDNHPPPYRGIASFNDLAGRWRVAEKARRRPET
jgi:hypothetical protein